MDAKVQSLVFDLTSSDGHAMMHAVEHLFNLTRTWEHQDPDFAAVLKHAKKIIPRAIEILLFKHREKIARCYAYNLLYNLTSAELPRGVPLPDHSNAGAVAGQDYHKIGDVHNQLGLSFHASYVVTYLTTKAKWVNVQEFLSNASYNTKPGATCVYFANLVRASRAGTSVQMVFQHDAPGVPRSSHAMFEMAANNVLSMWTDKSLSEKRSSEELAAAYVLKVYKLGCHKQFEEGVALANEAMELFPEDAWFQHAMGLYEYVDHTKSYWSMRAAVDCSAKKPSAISPAILLHDMAGKARLALRWKDAHEIAVKFLKTVPGDDFTVANMTYSLVGLQLLGLHDPASPVDLAATDADIKTAAVAVVKAVRESYAAARMAESVHEQLWGPLVSHHKHLAEHVMAYLNREWPRFAPYDSPVPAVPFHSEPLMGKARLDHVLPQCTSCGLVGSLTCKDTGCQGAGSSHHTAHHSFSFDLKACSGCRAVYYCDVRCQRRDWSRHKVQCRMALAVPTAPTAPAAPQ